MKKEYKTPAMKVIEISPVVLLITSGEQNLSMFDEEDMEELDEEDMEELDEEISQW